MPVKSWLCASALNPKLIRKALEVSADVVLFDLEDSVPTEKKDCARAALCGYFEQPVRTATAIRINSPDTVAGLKDLLCLVEREIAPDILLVPKALLPGSVEIVASLLKERGMERTQIFAIIETVESLWTLRTLSDMPNGLRGLIFGAADFAADMGVPPNVTDQRFAKQEIALAARRFGVTAIDSPCFHIQDQARLDLEARDARDLGFAGKIAIHPLQVSTINRLFTPSTQALADARKLVDACERCPGDSILRVDDGMVGPPFLKYARQVLSSNKPAGRR